MIQGLMESYSTIATIPLIILLRLISFIVVKSTQYLNNKGSDMNLT